MDGVVAYFDVTQIPGKNTFVSISSDSISEEEKLFLPKKGRIQYDHQPIGLIVASSTKLARQAADKVEVVYEKVVNGPSEFMDMERVIKSKDQERMILVRYAADEIGKSLIYFNKLIF